MLLVIHSFMQACVSFLRLPGLRHDTTFLHLLCIPPHVLPEQLLVCVMCLIVDPYKTDLSRIPMRRRAACSWSRSRSRSGFLPVTLLLLVSALVHVLFVFLARRYRFCSAVEFFFSLAEIWCGSRRGSPRRLVLLGPRVVRASSCYITC